MVALPREVEKKIEEIHEKHGQYAISGGSLEELAEWFLTRVCPHHGLDVCTSCAEWCEAPITMAEYVMRPR